jgi:hypothetical protein
LTFAVQVRQNWMRSRFIVVLLLFSSGAVAMAQTTPQDAIRQTISVLEQRLAQNPGDATWQYFLAVYYARAERKDDAFAMLEKLEGRATGLIADPELFPALASDGGFASLAARLEKTAPKVGRATVAFTIKQREGEEILPEALRTTRRINAGSSATRTSSACMWPTRKAT